MSWRTPRNYEKQRTLNMAIALSRHAGAGRHPSPPPRLDTGLRRYDGNLVPIRWLDIPRATIFEGGTEVAEFGVFFNPEFFTPRSLRPSGE